MGEAAAAFATMRITDTVAVPLTPPAVAFTVAVVAVDGAVYNPNEEFCVPEPAASDQANIGTKVAPN